MNAPIVAYLPTSTDITEVTLAYAVVLCVALVFFGFGYLCHQAFGKIQIVLAQRNLKRCVAIEIAENIHRAKHKAAIAEFDQWQRDRQKFNAIMCSGRVN